MSCGVKAPPVSHVELLQHQSLGCIPMLFEQDIAMLESESDCDVAAADKNRALFAVNAIYKMEGEFKQVAGRWYFVPDRKKIFKLDDANTDTTYHLTDTDCPYFKFTFGDP